MYSGISLALACEEALLLGLAYVRAAEKRVASLQVKVREPATITRKFLFPLRKPQKLD